MVTTRSNGLWAFSGLDGAGKSTQIARLRGMLESQGKPVRCIWARGGYTPGFEALKALVRHFSSRALPPPGRSEARTRRLGRPWVRRIWLIVAMLDLAWYYGVWVRVLRWRGFQVIADRWVEDTALDFALNFPAERTADWLLWRFMAWFAPKPSRHFFLVIPVDESLRRSVLKQEPFPDSAEVLARRLDEYENLARGDASRIRIDARRSIDEVSREISDACHLS